MKYIFTIFTLIFLYSQAAISSWPINTPLLEIPTYLDTKQLPPEQALQEDFKTDLYTSSQGSSAYAYWHKLSFDPKDYGDNHVIHLNLAYNVIEYLDFYTFQGKELKQHWQRGALQSWTKEGGHGNGNGIWIPIELSTEHTTTLLIRKQGEHQLLTPISLYDTHSANQAIHSEVFFWIIVITGMAVLLIHNLFVFGLLRNPGFGYYLALNALLFISVSSILGFSRWIFNEQFTQFLVANLFSVFALAAWSLYRFSLSFLAEMNIPKADCPIKRYGNWFFATYFIATFYLHTQTAGIIFAAIEICLFICCFYWGVKAYRKGFTAARFYLFSWLTLMIGSVLNTCIYWQILPVNLYTQAILPVASIIQLLGISFAFVDKARHIELSRQLQLHMDSSTQTPNRVYCFEQLGQLLADRYNHALVMIDITNYAKLSQAFGPAKADKVMCDIIVRIHRQLIQIEDVLALPLANKQSAFIMRVSSTRVAFVSTNPRVLPDQIASLKKVLDLTTNVDKVYIRHQYNIGSAIYPSQGNTIDSLYQNALVACDLASANDMHWLTFTSDLKNAHAKQLNMVGLLTDDIEKGRLHFDIQPQVDLNTLQVVGGEVLMRWNSEQLGFVSPGLFIPLAEKTGLINKLTCFIINETFRWVSQHPQATYERSLSINISALDLLQPNFAVQVIEKMEQYEITPSSINIEITETTIFDDNENVRSNVKQLQVVGFKLSIDDFGSGYSSLQNLIHLQVQELKIDRYFVEKITSDPQGATLCRSMISLSRELNIQSVAEGIEKPEEVTLLKEWQCRIGQGFLFHRPISPDKYLELIA
ncbi:EAL domain-containing protein [Marinomonas epiphytica]